MFPRTATHRLDALAERLGGECRGDPDTLITGLCPLDAQSSGSLTFIKVRSAVALARSLETLTCAAALVPGKLYAQLESLPSKPVILVPDPFAALLQLTSLFFEEHAQAPGVHPTADVHKSARLGKDISIGAHCTVGADVSLGDGVVLHSNVTLYEAVEIGAETTLHAGVVVRERCVLGKSCTVHPNTVIGADGFGYTPEPAVGLRKVPQVGRVVIGDRVEVGSGTCIDRGAIGDTVIGNGTKIDNLVQIGHNTVIGEHCVVCGQVGIAGSCRIADGVVLGGGAGVADHVTIVSGVRIAARGGAHSSVLQPGDYAGYPLRPASQWRRENAKILAQGRERSKSDSSKGDRGNDQ